MHLTYKCSNPVFIYDARYLYNTEIAEYERIKQRDILLWITWVSVVTGQHNVGQKVAIKEHNGLTGKESWTWFLI